jgi:hypothetical protein
MSELKVGDNIRTGVDSEKNEFLRVISFCHKDRFTTSTVIQIHHFTTIVLVFNRSNNTNHNSIIQLPTLELNDDHMMM